MSLSIEMSDLLMQRNNIEQQIREKRILFLTKKLNSIPVEFIRFHRQIPELFQELCDINVKFFTNRVDDLLDILETILDIDYTVDI